MHPGSYDIVCLLFSAVSAMVHMTRLLGSMIYFSFIKDEVTVPLSNMHKLLLKLGLSLKTSCVHDDAPNCFMVIYNEMFLKRSLMILLIGVKFIYRK